MFRAQLKAGCHQAECKHYLAGVSPRRQRKVLYVQQDQRKTHPCLLLHAGKLRHHYRRAKTITLILDNFIIHQKQTDRAMVEEESQSSAWCSASLQPAGHLQNEAVAASYRNHRAIINAGDGKPAGRVGKTLHGYRVMLRE